MGLSKEDIVHKETMLLEAYIHQHSTRMKNISQIEQPVVSSFNSMFQMRLNKVLHYDLSGSKHCRVHQVFLLFICACVGW